MYVYTVKFLCEGATFLLYTTFFAIPNFVALQRCANCKLHMLSFVHINVGDTHTSIKTFEFPFRLLLNNQVNLEFLYGTCLYSLFIRSVSQRCYDIQCR